MKYIVTELSLVRLALLWFSFDTNVFSVYYALTSIHKTKSFPYVCFFLDLYNLSFHGLRLTKKVPIVSLDIHCIVGVSTHKCSVP